MSKKTDFIELIKKQTNVDLSKFIDERYSTRNELNLGNIDRYSLHDVQWYLQAHPQHGRLVYNGGLGYSIYLK